MTGVQTCALPICSDKGNDQGKIWTVLAVKITEWGWDKDDRGRALVIWGEDFEV